MSALLSDATDAAGDTDTGPVMLAALAVLMLLVASGSFLGLMTKLARDRRL